MTTDAASRRAFWCVVALTAIGAGLRLWRFWRLGLTHFDEGIYALAGLWALDERGPLAIDPSVIPYAPGGFPFLVGLSYRLSFPWPGVSGLAAIAPALLCGIATIPVAAWLGRRTFGPGAGVAAAALAAVSGPHVAFSRMAMTDVPFLLAFLVALGFGGRFLDRPTLGRSLAMGIAVGVAQWFKYNGWLAGVIVAITAVLGLLRSDVRRTSVRAILLGIAGAVTAALVYLPWFLFVEENGSYGALLAHHRSYLGGWRMWDAYWSVQLDQATALAGSLAGRISWGAIAWPLAWIVAGFTVNGRGLVGAGPGAGTRFRLGLLLGTAALGGWPNLSWWAAIPLLPTLLRAERPAARLLGVWWLTLAVLTPFYHPYARLWLPLHAAGWLVLAGWVVRLGPFRGEETPAMGRPGWTLALGTCAALFLLVVAKDAERPDGSGWITPARPLPGLLAPTDALPREVARVLRFRPPTPGSLPVFVRPPVLFELTRAGVPYRRVGSLREVLRSSRPGDFVLLEDLLLDQETRVDPILGIEVDHRFGSMLPFPIWYHLNLPTLLDVDPSAASHPDGRRRPISALKLLRAS